MYFSKLVQSSMEIKVAFLHQQHKIVKTSSIGIATYGDLLFVHA